MLLTTTNDGVNYVLDAEYEERNREMPQAIPAGFVAGFEQSVRRLAEVRVDAMLR
jgi:hypothetical protein